jgi:hypothetical protein
MSVSQYRGQERKWGDWVRLWFPNYDAADMCVEREGLDKRWAEAGRAEHHVEKTCVIEDFLIRMSKWSLMCGYVFLMLLYFL